MDLFNLHSSVSKNILYLSARDNPDNHRRRSRTIPNNRGARWCSVCLVLLETITVAEMEAARWCRGERATFTLVVACWAVLAGSTSDLNVVIS